MYHTSIKTNFARHDGEQLCPPSKIRQRVTAHFWAEVLTLQEAKERLWWPGARSSLGFTTSLWLCYTLGTIYHFLDFQYVQQKILNLNFMHKFEWNKIIAQNKYSSFLIAAQADWDKLTHPSFHYMQLRFPNKNLFLRLFKSNKIVVFTMKTMYGNWENLLQQLSKTLHFRQTFEYWKVRQVLTQRLGSITVEYHEKN